MGADHPTNLCRARLRCTERAVEQFTGFPTELPTWVRMKTLLVLCSVLTSLSCIGAMAAIWSYVRVRKLLAGASARSLAELSSEVAELTSASELLSRQQRRLSQRVGMREARHKGEELREVDDESAPARPRRSATGRSHRPRAPRRHRSRTGRSAHGWAGSRSRARRRP